MPWQDARLSVTRRRYCAGMAKHIERFSPSGSDTTLVFRTKRHGNVPTGRMQGVRNNCDFRPISRFISETIQDRNSYAIYRLVLFSMTLNDP